MNGKWVSVLFVARRMGWPGLLFSAMMVLGGVADSQEWHYTLRPGDTIWNVTAEHLTKMDYWPKLQALNRVSDPERLPPGMKLRIPIPWLKRSPATAQVLKAHGHAQAVIAATNRTVPASPGLSLESGDVVLTGPDGNVTLEFWDGSRSLLQANSQLNLKSLDAYGATKVVDTLLNLLQGRVENQVTPRPPSGSRYEISTPVATSAVRGTRYRLAMDAGAATARTEVLEGAVAFRGRQKAARTVPTGFGALAEAGKPPSPPMPLLAQPDVAELPPVVTRVPIQLSFPAVRGAIAYRAQIAPDDRFETLLFDGVAPSPAVRGPDLPDGDYVLRVRGIDARGLEGRDAIHRFRLHARPEPPFLIRPPHQGAALEKSLVFEWSKPERAAAYHFQLAEDESFATPLLDVVDYRKTRLTPDRPLENLLTELRRKRVHMALVQDAKGTLVGLITMEDILEQLVGSIEDEFEESAPVRLADTLSEKRILLDLQAETSLDAIAEIVHRTNTDDIPLTQQAIIDSVSIREKSLSTYLGHGLAVPHARLESLKTPCLFIARSAKGVRFDTTNEECAQLVFMLLTPSQLPKIQVRLLARIAALRESDYVWDRLMNATTPAEIVEAIRGGDELTVN